MSEEVHLFTGLYYQAAADIAFTTSKLYLLLQNEMVEGTENKLSQIEHIMKAINLSKGFHMSLSGTDRESHAANTASWFGFVFFLNIIYFNRVFPADLWFYTDQKNTNKVCSSNRG